MGLEQINYFLATHCGSDHIGGFHELIDEGITFTANVFDRGNKTSRTRETAKGNVTEYGNYVDYAAPIRTTIEPGCDNQINLGPDISVTVVAAAGQFWKAAEPSCELDSFPYPRAAKMTSALPC